MSADSGPIAGLTFLIVILIIAIGFFVASKTAMESLNRNYIKNLAQDGNTKAQGIAKVIDNPYSYLITIEVVIIFILLIIAGIMGYYYTEYLNSILVAHGLPRSLGITMIIALLVLTFFVFAFGILLPKRIALLHADKIALNLYNITKFIGTIFRPLAFICNLIAVFLLKAFRQRTDVTEAGYSEDEVVSMLESGQESGELKEEGMKMITSIFAFDDMLAYEVMTPRTDVFSIDINEPAEKYIDELMEMRYSRIPVFEEDNDNIIGVLYIKDFLIAAYEVGFENIKLREILRKPYMVPETKKIDSLFVELQTAKQHIAILIDEYGGFSGIVTMEDIIEEVMGDIDDEYDKVEPEIQKLSDTVYIIDGSMDIDDIDEELDIDLESDNSETIGGFIIDILGEIPDEDDIGSTVEYENYKFRIDSIKDRRIEKITLTIMPLESDDNEEDNG